MRTFLQLVSKDFITILFSILFYQVIMLSIHNEISMVDPLHVINRCIAIRTSPMTVIATYFI